VAVGPEVSGPNHTGGQAWNPSCVALPAFALSPATGLPVDEFELAHSLGALIALCLSAGAAFHISMLLCRVSPPLWGTSAVFPRTLGAGDAKFMAAVGAWAGLSRLPMAFLAMLGVGALTALAWSWRKRVLRATLASTATMVGGALHGTSAGTPWVGQTDVGRFPYGVGLGLGAIIWWLWTGCRLP
jgi:prepilin signal peptidase PulO-like enzyme (type II secretory pathway)